MIEETQAWLDKDQRYVWHGMGGYNPSASPMVAVEADGSWVTDIDGNR
jgi:taurine-pyruvate aminotransferase